MIEDDISEELQVFNMTFDAMDYSVFYNKHLNNPNCLSQPIRNIIFNGRIVGISAFDQVEFIYKDKVVKAVQVGDVAVMPEYRGNGFFTKLQLDSEEHLKSQGVEVGFGFPNINSLHGFCKLGWNSLGNFYNYYKVVSCKRSFSEVKEEVLRIETISINSRNHYCISNELLDEMNHSMTIGVKKSREYYEWRIDQNSSTDFYYLIMENDGKEKAVFIYMLQEKRGFIICRVVDWFISGQSMKDKNRYIKKFEHVVKKYCNIINFSFVNKASGEHLLLRGRRYLGKPNQGQPQLIMRKFNHENQSQEIALRDVYFREIDMDTIFNY